MIRLPSVYLADDDPDDLEFFAAGMHRMYPHTKLFLFKDGSELVNSLSGSPELPHYLIFDYRMPTLSAPQLLEATGAGTRYELIPKIVWSTSSRQKDIDECLQLGATRYVIKPTSEDELETFLRSLHIPALVSSTGAPK